MSMAKNHVFRWAKANYALSLALVISAVLGYQFLEVQKLAGTNFSYDAGAYLGLADQYGRAILGRGDIPFEPLRTSTYPLFLLFTISLGRIFSISAAESVFVVQLIIWWSVLAVAHFGLGKFLLLKLSGQEDSSQYKRLKLGRDILVIGLGLNIFVSPYLSVGLTDSVYTSLSLMFLVWITLYASKKERGGASAFTGVFLASTALVVRPAAIWLFILMALVLVFSFAAAKKSLQRRSLRQAGKAIFISLAGSFPLLIQSFIQYLKFGVFSPLPVADLGGLQVLWGIQNVKYATWLGEGAPQNYYPSEELIGPQSPEGVSWYWENIIPSIQLLTFKLIGAFDFDFLVPYPTEQLADNRLFGLVSLLTFTLGMIAVVTHLFRPLESLGPRWLPALIFVSWGAINLVLALELRFSLPLVLYFFMISIPMIDRVWNSRPELKIWYSLATAAMFSIAWIVAAEVRSYSVLN